MKKQQDHSVVTHWGGRSERYRKFPSAVHRAHDPFGLQPIQFAQAFHYEAWVLERFDPNTRSITNEPTTVSAVIDGERRQATSTFVVTRRDHSVDYFLASKTDAPPSTLPLLRRLAQANRARVVLRTRAEIRARIVEFWWLEKLRQVTTIWAGKGAELDEALTAIVAADRKTLSELGALFNAHTDLIRSRLARLHVAGRLIVDRENGELVARAFGSGEP